MRAKILHRPGGKLLRKPQPLAGWLSDFAQPDDADLADDLAEIILTFRAQYAILRRPSNQALKATLKDLVLAGDDDLLRIQKVVDDWVRPHLATASLLFHRKTHPQGDLPNGWCDIESWPLEFTRLMARDAMAKLARDRPKGGRRPLQKRDVQFGMALVRYWRSQGKRPTVTAANSYNVDKESEFLSWAWQMFDRAGRRTAGQPLSPSRLAAILRQASRAT